MANIQDYFLTDRDIKNLDDCADTCHSNIFETCRLAAARALPCDIPIQVKPGGGKKSSKKGGALLPCDPNVATKNWTTSLLDKINNEDTLKADEEMIWFYKNFLPTMGSGLSSAGTPVLDFIIVNTLINEYVAGFFQTLAPCCLNAGASALLPPNITKIIQLDAGHDFFTIRPMGETPKRQGLFQTDQPLFKYLLIHQQILVPFLRKATQLCGFDNKFFGSTPNESNILMEIMQKSNFGTRKAYFHSWADIDTNKNPGLGFEASPPLYIRSSIDIIPGGMPYNNNDILPYLFPIEEEAGVLQITDISSVSKLLDGTNSAGKYHPTSNPIEANEAGSIGAHQRGIFKYNESIVEVKNAYSCLNNIGLILVSIVDVAGGAGNIYMFQIAVPGGVVVNFSIEKTGGSKTFLGGQPFCHVLICLIISADYSAIKSFDKSVAMYGAKHSNHDKEKKNIRKTLRTYLLNMKSCNSLSLQFHNLEEVIVLWEKLQITSQQFIAILLMTKQLGDFGQANTWCMDNNNYEVTPDPAALAAAAAAAAAGLPPPTTTDFTADPKQAIINITGDKLCMASFARKISDSNSNISNHIGGYWANTHGCFVIYPKHAGFASPKLLSKLKLPANVSSLGKGGTYAKKNRQIGAGHPTNVTDSNFLMSAIYMIKAKTKQPIPNFELSWEIMEEDIIKIEGKMKAMFINGFCPAIAFDESALKRFSSVYEGFKDILYKTQECMHNITTIQQIIRDALEEGKVNDADLALAGVEQTLYNETVMLQTRSDIYYGWQDAMLFWFNVVLSKKKTIDDWNANKYERYSEDAATLENWQKALQLLNNEYILAKNQGEELFKIVHQKWMAAGGTRGGSSKYNKKKNKEKLKKEKEKEKLKKEKEKEKLKKEKEKEKLKKEKEKEKEKLKKEKEKEKLKKQKEKEKLKKQKEKEKLKREKDKEK